MYRTRWLLGSRALRGPLRPTNTPTGTQRRSEAQLDERAKTSVHICVQSKAATSSSNSHESKQFGGKRLVVRNEADCGGHQQSENGQHRTRTCDLHGVKAPQTGNQNLC